jgi:threonine dehydrogenase-like Zn-dependent dehydrogenase
VESSGELWRPVWLTDFLTKSASRIDAVGHPAVFEQAFYARDLAGRVVLVGVPTPT